MNKIAVFYNKLSGRKNHNKNIKNIVDVLNELNYQHQLFFLDEIKDLSKKLISIKDQYKLVLLCGGDGTYHSFVNDLVSSDLHSHFHIFLYPLGTVNDTAKYLKIKKGRKYLKKLLSSYEPITYDLYKINDQHFIYTAAVGKFSQASYLAKRKTIRKLGYFAYLMSAFVSLFKKSDIILTIERENKVEKVKTNLLLLMGIPRLARFNYSKKLNITHDDGLLDVFLFKRKTWLSWINIALFVLTGGRIRYNLIKYKINKAIFEIEPNRTWNLDGDSFIFGKRVEVSVTKEKIIVNVLKKDNK